MAFPPELLSAHRDLRVSRPKFRQSDLRRTVYFQQLSESLFEFAQLQRLCGDHMVLCGEHMLLVLHFVQQHRRKLFVVNALDFPRVIANHEFRIHFVDFFGDQAVLLRTPWVRPVVKGDGSQLLKFG